LIAGLLKEKKTEAFSAQDGKLGWVNPVLKSTYSEYISDLPSQFPIQKMSILTEQGSI
jgi:hypothetical protein